MAAARPYRIEPRFVERIWGSFHLRPWFADPAVKTGEVWFPAGELLIKFLFTTEALSVQVHPEDDYARRHHDSAGKTEMWHILAAEPGARIAAGFREAVDPDEARRAAVDGSIEELLEWHEARPGDTFFVPAGTVHALGAGLVVCEIQQASDITYRLYDYGRGRELHLERGFEVAQLRPHGGRTAPQPLPGGGQRIAACSYFVTERWQLTSPRQWQQDSVLIGTGGRGRIGEEEFGPGQVWVLPKGVGVRPEGDATVLRTHVP